MQELDTSYISNTLAKLRKAQPSVFGSEFHRFRLNPVLSETAVSQFEAKHTIKLPGDYRRFVTNVANGGAGPFYGIFPLGEMDDNFGLKSWQEDDGFVGQLSRPFLLEEEWNDLSSMPDDALAESNEAEYDRQMEVFDSTYWRPINGAIPICHEGCAIRVWLIVSGSLAGQLWEDRRSEYAGLKPLLLSGGSATTFSGWYRNWLDECVANL